MEDHKKGFANKLKSITSILQHGLFWHGVRNNLARLGLDFMPYYWSKAISSDIIPQKLKTDNNEFKLSVFDETELKYIKNIIIGIEEKDFFEDLRNGENASMTITTF